GGQLRPLSPVVLGGNRDHSFEVAIICSWAWTANNAPGAAIPMLNERLYVRYGEVVISHSPGIAVRNRGHTSKIIRRDIIWAGDNAPATAPPPQGRRKTCPYHGRMPASRIHGRGRSCACPGAGLGSLQQ